MLKRILHTGIATTDLEKAISLYKTLGFEVSKKFHKPDLNADIAMMVNGETTYELFQFNDPDHPQIQFIRSHVAIYSDALEEDVDRLVKQGYKLVIPVTEGIIFRYAFVQDSSGTNYEIATEKTSP